MSAGESTSGTVPTATADDGVHVVHVATRYIGGAMRRMQDVIDAVPGRHTVVMGPDSEVRRLPELAGRADVVIVDSLGREVSPRADARALVDLVAALRRLRPDVVHTHQAKAGLLGRVAARAAGVRTVYHSASMASFGPGYGRRESRIFQVAETITSPLVGAYFVVGDDLARRLATEARVPERKLVVVRSHVDRRRFPSVDPQRRAEGRAAWSIEPDAPVALFVGSLEARKGVASLPGALGAVGRPLTLLVAGTGPLADEVAASEVDGVEVRLLGHVDDVGALMAAADVVVLPSTAEGVPQVLVQAAMVGVPFVAHDVDGVHELLALGARGAAVAIGDRAALAAAVGEVLGGPPGGVGVPEAAWGAWTEAAIADGYRSVYSGGSARRPGRLSGRRGSRGPSGSS